MEPITKKRLSYFVIGIYFLLGGVEYAVILPSAWEYLDSQFGAEPYMLGMLMSAFCLSGLAAGPLMGRWSDKTGRTKMIFLFANLWEIVGNIMYFLGFSAWFLVASRFIAGVGTGIGSALFADIARITSNEERTSVLSTFMAVRQVGLIAGPGCNLFLRELHFSIGQFEVNKMTAPGVFMAVMWIILEVLVLLIYFDLPNLCVQLQETLLAQDLEYSLTYDEVSVPTQAANNYGSINTESLDAGSSPSLQAASVAHRHPTVISHKGSWPPYQAPQATVAHAHRALSLDVEAVLTSSSELIESAERCMNSSFGDSISPIRRYPPVAEELPDGTLRQLTFETSQSASTGSSAHGAPENEPPAGVGNDTSQQPDSATGNTYIVPHIRLRSETANNSHKSRTQSTVSRASSDYPESDSGQSRWQYYYDEYFREEVIALLATVFVSFFDQLALETMVTPLTKKLLGWDDKQNSILYSVCGVEIIIIFILIRFLSRIFDDRQLLMFGFLVDTVTNCFYLWFLPSARALDSHRNFPLLIVGVFLNLAGLPFLMVAGVSLYSKVTSEETQGFSQGLRRVAGGLGNLLGPLWAGGLLVTETHLYILMSVMVALMVIAVGMLILSYDRLKEHARAPGIRSRSNPCSASRPPANERSRLLDVAS